MAGAVPLLPFVGRPETVEELQRRFEDARAGTGGVTVLVGDTGVGKSTLVAELVQGMRARGVRVLEGRALAADAPPPFSLLKSALEPAAEAGAAGTSASLADALGGEVLIGFAPRLGDEFGRAPVRVEERILQALGEEEDLPGVRRESLWSALVDQFRDFLEQGPTVLVLEDLHRADDPSLDAVEHLARQLKDQPLWVLVTVRSHASLSPARRARLESFERATEARRLTLAPLTSVEVESFLRQREPDREFTEEEIARRFSETGGNPLLLEQLDRRVAAGGTGALGVEAAGLLPAEEPLSEEEERALSVAAVIGPEVPFVLLLRASGEEEERLAETVDRLVGRGLLFERPGELLTFGGDEVRSQLYDQLTETRRRLLHRRVGEALEAAGHADASTIYALARHFYLGKVDDRSVRYNRTAAEIASRTHASEIAREHLERALESLRRAAPDDWTTETELVLELAEQSEQAGAFAKAELLLRHHLNRPGLAEKVPASLRTLAETYLARIETDRGNWAAAEEVTARLLATPRLDGDPAVLVALRHLHAESMFYQGRYAESLAEHDEELRVARQAGNERAAALARSRRASVLSMMGRSDEALAEGREAGATLERLGDLRSASQARLFVGVVVAGLKGASSRLEESVEAFSEAVRLAEAAGDPRRVGWALFNWADILREAGRLEEAWERDLRARELLERIGDRFGLVQSLIVAGKIATAQREFDRAEAELLDAYRIVRELKAPADEVDVMLRLAQLSFARGDLPSARRRTEELERLNVRALRPDVVADFDELREAVAHATSSP